MYDLSIELVLLDSKQMSAALSSHRAPKRYDRLGIQRLPLVAGAVEKLTIEAIAGGFHLLHSSSLEELMSTEAPLGMVSAYLHRLQRAAIRDAFGLKESE